ncbi:Hypothetical predicted protein [Xyrichtys novacula]|uniref:Uncharacterized protein n=1 Tax=Xyrichtys novacula TaxID=13765 RepID=A0AAV1GU36_XYRNO|nr:Hypothetical predicted protein [Xyrichtys novacula]
MRCELYEGGVNPSEPCFHSLQELNAPASSAAFPSRVSPDNLPVFSPRRSALNLRSPTLRRMSLCRSLQHENTSEDSEVMALINQHACDKRRSEVDVCAGGGGYLAVRRAEFSSEGLRF